MTSFATGALFLKRSTKTAVEGRYTTLRRDRHLRTIVNRIRWCSADLAWTVAKRLPAVHPLAKFRAWLRGVRGLQVAMLPPEQGKPAQVALFFYGGEQVLNYVKGCFVQATEAARQVLRANHVIQTDSIPADPLQTPVFQQGPGDWEITMSLIDYAHVQSFLIKRLPLPKDLAYKQVKELVDSGGMEITFAATHARGNSNITTIALRNAYDLTPRGDFLRIPMDSDASYAAILTGYYEHMFQKHGSHPDDWPQKPPAVRILLKGHAAEVDPGGWLRPGAFRKLSDVVHRVVLCVRDPLLTWDSALGAFILQGRHC